MDVIQVSNISKMFRLGTSTGDLRERVGVLFSRKSRGEDVAQDFWALRDISFTVAQGESFGIIGHNGSGKSTLLKLLTGIYRPTSGTFKMHGRISALIEVGAGFHPDLTGRENVYLNGSVLGLKRREIDRLFDEIVAFSELEQFIDTPVKRYSSGMYMRLGFAVAAHVDPEIVLVDEVLAVGDESFQKKAMAKMLSLRKQGKTIVFISHAMSSILDLCDRVMVLSHGKMLGEGEPREIIDMYRNSIVADNDVRRGRIADDKMPVQSAIPKIRILNVRVLDEHGNECSAMSSGDGVRLVCSYHAETRVEEPVFGAGLHRLDGLHIYGVNTILDHAELEPIEVGDGEFSLSFSSLPLSEGAYTFTASIARRDLSSQGGGELLDRWQSGALFTINTPYRLPGIVNLDHAWEQKTHRCSHKTFDRDSVTDQSVMPVG